MSCHPCDPGRFTYACINWFPVGGWKDSSVADSPLCGVVVVVALACYHGLKEWRLAEFIIQPLTYTPLNTDEPRRLVNGHNSWRGMQFTQIHCKLMDEWEFRKPPIWDLLVGWLAVLNFYQNVELLCYPVWQTHTHTQDGVVWLGGSGGCWNMSSSSHQLA